jgi:hypothetical protein
VQTSRQVEEKQLVSPPWQCTCSHITRFSTVPDFQKHYSDSPPPCLTSPPATFSYSPRWNYGWKGIVLTQLRRTTQKRKRLSTHSHLRTSRDEWNHGKQAGIAVYMPKGTTSKETVETRSFGKKLFLWSNSPNLWVAPHIWMWNRWTDKRGGKTEALRENPVPVLFCPPQIPYEVSWNWTRSPTVKCWWQTAWGMSRSALSVMPHVVIFLWHCLLCQCSISPLYVCCLQIFTFYFGTYFTSFDTTFMKIQAVPRF